MKMNVLPLDAVFNSYVGGFFLIYFFGGGGGNDFFLKYMRCDFRQNNNIEGNHSYECILYHCKSLILSVGILKQ